MIGRKRTESTNKWAWKQEGKNALQSLRNKFRGVVGIVGPHYLKTILNENIVSLSLQIREQKNVKFVQNTWVMDPTVDGNWRKLLLSLSAVQIIPVRRNFSARLVLAINEEKLQRFNTSKYRIIRKYWQTGFQVDRNRSSEYLW
jgi:hypothetical protein